MSAHELCFYYAQKKEKEKKSILTYFLTNFLHYRCESFSLSRWIPQVRLYTFEYRVYVTILLPQGRQYTFQSFKTRFGRKYLSACRICTTAASSQPQLGFFLRCVDGTPSNRVENERARIVLFEYAQKRNEWSFFTYFLTDFFHYHRESHSRLDSHHRKTPGGSQGKMP